MVLYISLAFTVAVLIFCTIFCRVHLHIQKMDDATKQLIYKLQHNCTVLLHEETNQSKGRKITKYYRIYIRCFLLLSCCEFLFLLLCYVCMMHT